MNPVFSIYTKYFIVPFYSYFHVFFVNNSSYMRIQAFFPECRHVPSRFPPQEFQKIPFIFQYLL